MKIQLNAFFLMFLATFMTTSLALACSCMRLSDKEKLDQAAIAFTGKVLSRKDISQEYKIDSTIIQKFKERNPDSKLSDAEIEELLGLPFVLTTRLTTFSVISVQKGEIGDSVDISHGIDGAMCGVDFAMGDIYQVFASERGGRYSTNLCAGSTKLSETP